jgi:hypothetical protein
MNESWRPVPGYEGRYEVSDLGDVVSLRFAKSHQRRSLKKVVHGKRWPHVQAVLQ